MTLDFKQLIANISNKKYIYILGLVGIFLIFISSFPKENPPENIKETEVDYCTKIEEKLERILPDIANVGKVSVMVTVKNYGNTVFVRDMVNAEEKTVIINQKGGGEGALVSEERNPLIQGVIIVAEGGRSDKVKGELTEAVSALLGVEAHRIKIFERKMK